MEESDFQRCLSLCAHDSCVLSRLTANSSCLARGWAGGPQTVTDSELLSPDAELMALEANGVGSGFWGLVAQT
jgi:hypothetical protein